MKLQIEGCVFILLRVAKLAHFETTNKSLSGNQKWSSFPQIFCQIWHESHANVDTTVMTDNLNFVSKLQLKVSKNTKYTK